VATHKTHAGNRFLTSPNKYMLRVSHRQSVSTSMFCFAPSFGNLIQGDSLFVNLLQDYATTNDNLF
jgi:hypothetical protein